MTGFWGKSHWGALGGPNRFCDEKVGPGAPKVRPRTKNEPKMTPENPSNVKKSSKKSPESEKELQKWTLFASRPGGLREALTINVCWRTGADLAFCASEIFRIISSFSTFASKVSYSRIKSTGPSLEGHQGCGDSAVSLFIN